MLPASNRAVGANIAAPDVCLTPAGPAVVPVPYTNMALNCMAVQFSTTPHVALAAHAAVKTVTFLNPEDALHALPQHTADMAFVWGPSAGYANATFLHGGYKIVPMAGNIINATHIDSGTESPTNNALVAPIKNMRIMVTSIKPMIMVLIRSCNV